MPFKSSARRSGVAVSGGSGRSNSKRVSQAGRGHVRRLRGSEHIESPIEPVPALGTPIISAIAATTATVTTQTNTSDGIFYWIIDTLITKPSVAQIKAGLDSGGAAAVDAGNAAAANPNVALATGLITATAYFAHCYQENAGGGSAVVTSIEFTTL